MFQLLKKVKEKNQKKKEVKKMKRLSILLIAFLLILPYAAFAETQTSSVQSRIIHISYNPYGIATSQTQVTDGTVTTIGDLYFQDVNGDGKYTEGTDHLLTKEEVGIDDDGDGTPDRTEIKYYYLKADGSDEDTAPDIEYVSEDAAGFTHKEKGSISTREQDTIATSSWHNGNLVTDKVETTSHSYIYVDADGDGKADDITGDGKVDDNDKIETSTSHTVDLYSYDANGALTGVTGGGTYQQFTTYVDSSGARVHYLSGQGTITKEYKVETGQALLVKTISEGDAFDKDGKDIGDSIDIDTVTEWEYLGGQWVAKTQKTVSFSVSHAASSQITKAISGDVLDKILAGEANETDIENAIKGAGVKISSYQRTEKQQTFSRNDAGVVTGIDLEYATYVEEGGKKIPKSYQITVTGEDQGNPSLELFILTQAPDPADSSKLMPWAEIKFDETMGWYISDEWMAWKKVANPDWTDGTWGDPAVTGSVFQGEDGKWYMRVTTWTNEEKTESTTATIELNLDAMSPEQRQAMQQILQQYAASGEALTLYGMSQGHVISEGAKLVVMGLGKGSFSAHPFDFEGDIPDSLAGGVDEDFAEFVASMINAPYANQVLGGLSADARYTTLSELYDVLVNGDLKMGGSFTTSTGVTFSIVSDGPYGPARLDAQVGGQNYWFRHLTQALVDQLHLI